MPGRRSCSPERQARGPGLITQRVDHPARSYSPSPDVTVSVADVELDATTRYRQDADRHTRRTSPPCDFQQVVAPSAFDRGWLLRGANWKVAAATLGVAVAGVHDHATLDKASTVGTVESLRHGDAPWTVGGWGCLARGESQRAVRRHLDRPRSCQRLNLRMASGSQCRQEVAQHSEACRREAEREAGPAAARGFLGCELSAVRRGKLSGDRQPDAGAFCAVCG